VRAAVMDRDHLDIHMVPSAVGVFVLDARVRKMHLLVEVRQLVLASPLFDLVLVAVGVAVVVAAVTIVLVQPLLVITLDLVIQDDTIDACATLFQPLRFTFEGSIDLDVVFELPFAFNARLEGLGALPVAVSMPLEAGSVRPWSARPRSRANRGCA
jgi:hypothetical protein